MASYAEYPYHSGPSQRAQNVPAGAGGAPSEFPLPGDNRPEPFDAPIGWAGVAPGLRPSGSSIDPHDTPYEKSPQGVFEPLRPAEGELPSNIVDHGGHPGPFSGYQPPVWTEPRPQADPHS